MKKSFTRYLLLTAIALYFAPLSTKAAWPTYDQPNEVTEINGTYYVLVHNGEESISIIGSAGSKTYSLHGPGGQITFEAKRDLRSSAGNLNANQCANGTWETTNIFEDNPPTSYKTYGPFTLKENATAVKFYTKVGATWTKYFKNIKITMAECLTDISKTDIDFNTHQINKGGKCTKDTITIDWSNISNLQLNGLEGTPFEAKVLSVGCINDPNATTVSKGKWGTAKIQITFWHHTAGTHTATLVIKGDTHTQSVLLHGKISKLDQQIEWADQWETDQEHTITTGMTIVNAATATSKLPVTYAISDADAKQGAIMISEDAKSFLAVKATTTPITIIAQQTGNDEFNPVQSERKFIVSDKQQLFISWNQDLTHLSIDDDPITLSAKVLVVADMNTGTLAEDPTRTAQLKYSIDYQQLAEIDHTTLTPKQIGNGIITVTFDGDEQYESASVRMPIYIRDATVGCEDQLLLSDNQEITFFDMNVTKPELYSAPIAIDHGKGIPGTLVFMHKREYWTLAIKYSKGTILAQESTDGGNSWKDLPNSEIEPNIGQYTLSPKIPLSRNATHIRFVRPKGGEGYHFITGIQIYPAQFIETVSEHNFGTVHVGSENQWSFTINYSNIKSNLLITTSDPDAVQLSETTIKDDCGAWAEKTIDLTFVPKKQNANYSSTITITDVAANLSTTLKLLAGISINAQTITWEPTKTTLQSVADLECTATSSSKLPVSYKVAANNDVADFDDNGHFVIYKNGEVTIQAYHPGNEVYSPAEKSITFTVQLTPTFYSSGAFDDANNWNNGRTPTTTDNVIIAADMHIANLLSVAGMTINPNTTVTIQNGGHLTIGDNSSAALSSYGNLIIENGGKVTLGNGKLLVNDFGIEAQLGNDDTPPVSGQISNPGSLSIQGETYFELTLDQPACTYGWYDFTVPFPVDAQNGVFRWEDNDIKHLTFGTHYIIMDHHEDLQARGQYSWKAFRGIMTPNACYTITVDAEHNTFRFYKTKGSNLANTTSHPLQVSDGDDARRGWNGLGNGTLQYASVDMDGLDKVQIYDHASNSYTPAQGQTFAIGSAFFVQAKQNGDIRYTPATSAPQSLRAPKNIETFDCQEVILQLLHSDRVIDRLYFSASDTALSTYQIGHDLLKMGDLTQSRVARLWSVAYGLNLCDVELPATTDETVFDLHFFAPQADEYTLSIDNQPANATVYLLRDGEVIANLSAGDYTITLPQGVTDTYELLLKAAPQVTTDINAISSSTMEAEKVLHNGQLYILYHGQVFDASGHRINQ